MKRQTILKSTLCLIMALVCNVAWAQTNTDGPIVTFTNVQKDGTTTFTLYINDNNQLAASTDDAATLGAKAQFRATLQSNGKYTFYNETKGLYMIWRGKGYGHNGDKGVLAEYNATYCDWTMNASSNVSGAYYFVGKRSNGNDDGSLVIKSTGAFDAYGNSQGYADTYSNLYRIEGEEYTATLTDTKGVVHECTAKGLPLSGATITNSVWKSGNLTADVAFTIPVSTEEVTNRVIIGSFNDFNNKYFADGTSVKANRDSSAPLPSNVNAKNYLWAFYPTLEGSVFKFKIKNIGTGTYIKGEAAESDHSGDEVSLVAEAEATPFALTASNQLVNAKGYRLSNGSTTGAAIKYIGTFNTDHNGTKNKIVDANNYTLTLADGSTFVGSNGVHNLLGGSYTYSDGAWSDNGYSATVNVDFTSLPFPVSSAEVTNAMMISSFKNDTHQPVGSFKWRASDDNNNVAITKSEAVVAANLNKHLWAIYPALVNGTFSYAIKSIAVDKYIYTEAAYAQNSGSADNNKETVTLQNNPTYFLANDNGQFYYTANVSGNNVTQYLSLGSVDTTDGFLNVYAKNHGGTYNSFHTPASIGTTGFATLYSPIALTIPANVQAYTGTLDGEWLKLNEVTGTIPANTAVVLQGSVSTIFAFATTTANTEAITDNALRGTATEIETSSVTDGVVYTLQPDQSGAGVVFGQYTGTTLAAGKAYLVLPEGQKSISIRFEGSTDIENVEIRNEKSEMIFDLMGRRVQTMTKGGIYIVNGKKVVIR